MGIRDVSGIATAAVRDAANGAEFLNRAERLLDCKIELVERPAGSKIVGPWRHKFDLQSGWSCRGFGWRLTPGLSTFAARRPLRGSACRSAALSLMDLSERSPKKAAKIVREKLLGEGEGAPRVAWSNVLCRRRHLARSCAVTHMRQRQYPMNGNAQLRHIPSRDALEFASLVERIEADALLSIESVSAARRPLLAYGAAVLEEIIRRCNPKEIVVSAPRRS